MMHGTDNFKIKMLSLILKKKKSDGVLKENFCAKYFNLTGREQTED